MTLEEILGARGIEYTESGNEININCPFCVEMGTSQDSKLRLGINLTKDVAHCFNCGWGSKHGTFKKILEALDIRGLSDEEEIEKSDKVEEETFASELPKGFERLWPVPKDEDCRAAYKYLKQRRVSDKQIKKNRIGITFVSKYRYRIIFPIYVDKELHGFVGRDYTEKQALRYKNSIGKKTLYNLPKKQQRIAMLFEGIFDCLAGERVLRKYGVDCLALLGKSIKDSQVELLSGYEEVIIIPDIDHDGMKASLRVAEKLKDKFEVYFGFLKSWKDTSKALEKGDIKAIKNLLRKRQRYSESLRRKLRTKVAFDMRGV
jgi:DNA primase